MKISVGKCKVRRQSFWRVRWSEGVNIRRKFFEGKEAADAYAVKLRKEAPDARQWWAMLPEAEKLRVMTVFAEARERGVDLLKLLLHPVSESAVVSPGIGKVVTEMLEVKLKAGRAKAYVGTLRVVLNRFVKAREAMPMNQVSLMEVEKFIDGHSVQYRATLRSRLSTWFKFGVRRGYCLANPCDRLESVTVVRAAPTIFTIEQIKQAVAAMTVKFKPHKHSRKIELRHGLTWFGLTTFCGLRPEEAEKTTRAEINFNEGSIIVFATKTSQRRVVYPLPQAMAFIKWSLANGGVTPIHPMARQRIIWRLRSVMGWARWPKDITRHTAASYWLAESGNAHAVALSLGHSERILQKHYKALVTKVEAAKFWECVARTGHSATRAVGK